MTAPDARTPQDPDPTQQQAEPEASSDGDGSWTADPVTQDPHEDRSVENVIEQTTEYGDGDATDEG